MSLWSWLLPPAPCTPLLRVSSPPVVPSCTVPYVSTYAVPCEEAVSELQTRSCAYIQSCTFSSTYVTCLHQEHPTPALCASIHAGTLGAHAHVHANAIGEVSLGRTAPLLRLAGHLPRDSMPSSLRAGLGCQPVVCHPYLLIQQSYVSHG